MNTKLKDAITEQAKKKDGMTIVAEEAAEEAEISVDPDMLSLLPTAEFDGDWQQTEKLMTITVYADDCVDACEESNSMIESCHSMQREGPARTPADREACEDRARGSPRRVADRHCHSFRHAGGCTDRSTSTAALGARQVRR